MYGHAVQPYLHRLLFKALYLSLGCESEQGYHCTQCVSGFHEFTEEIPELGSLQARFAAAASANIGSALVESLLCDVSCVPHSVYLGFITHTITITLSPNVLLYR